MKKKEVKKAVKKNVKRKPVAVKWSSEWWENARMKLKEKFPTDAWQINTERTGRLETGYIPDYLYERLNEVFGVNGWDVKIVEQKVIESSEQVYIKVELRAGQWKLIDGKNVFQIEARRLATGGCKFLGKQGSRVIFDSIKGAETDAIKKAASKFGIGQEFYKGSVTTTDAENVQNKKVCKQNGWEFVEKPEKKNPVCPNCQKEMNWMVSEKGGFWMCKQWFCKNVVSDEDVSESGVIKNPQGYQSQQNGNGYPQKNQRNNNKNFAPF